MRNFIVVGIVFWVCLGCVYAQSSEMNDLCATINENVVIPQNPLKVQREKHISACTFKLTLEKDKSVSFRVERYSSRKGASFELESLRQRWIRKDANEYPPKIKYKNNIDPDGFWDEAAYSDDSYSENFILLRQEKYFIMILGSDFSVIKRTEHLLRNIRFEK